jgi:chemotaxis protein histidine kinase CheA
MDGDIEVKSEPGFGSEFIVTLPFNYNELVTKS